MIKLLPPLRIHKLSKKSQEKYEEIKKKLYTANMNWNYWKFQLHWNKLEWVDPRSKTKRKIYSLSSKKFYIDKCLRTAHWVVHSLLKKIYYNGFYRKHMIEDLESDLTGSSEETLNTDYMALYEV